VVISLTRVFFPSQAMTRELSGLASWCYVTCSASGGLLGGDNKQLESLRRIVLPQS
jgi:hypothetical protein